MSEVDRIRAEIRAITAETIEYMRVLHAEKMAKLDELEAWLHAQRKRDRGSQKRRNPRKRIHDRKQQ